MTRFTAYVGLNLDSRFGPYTPGDRVHSAARLVVEADSVEAAFEKVYVVGNRMSADAEGRSWSPDVRSISVGDVIAIRPRPFADAVAKTVASFGFTDVNLGTLTTASRDDAVAAGAIRA